MAAEGEYSRACFEAIVSHAEEMLALLKLTFEEPQVNTE